MSLLTPTHSVSSVIEISLLFFKDNMTVHSKNQDFVTDFFFLGQFDERITF